MPPATEAFANVTGLAAPGLAHPFNLGSRLLSQMKQPVGLRVREFCTSIASSLREPFRFHQLSFQRQQPVISCRGGRVTGKSSTSRL